MDSLDLRKVGMEAIGPDARMYFLAISGSHAYSTATANSDYDIRGVFVSPTEDLFGLERSIDFIKYDKQGIDLTLDEIGKYFGLVAKGDIHRTSWPNHPMICRSSNFQDLKTLVNGEVSKLFGRKLLNFGEATSRVAYAGDLKKGLYVLRAYLMGIHAMKSGKIVPNLEDLNDLFGIRLVGDLLEKRGEGADFMGEGLTRSFTGLVLDLGRDLEIAIEDSDLKDSPNRDRIEDYLIQVRRENL